MAGLLDDLTGRARRLMRHSWQRRSPAYVVFAAIVLAGGTTKAEPVELGLADMDRITAGAAEPMGAPMVAMPEPINITPQIERMQQVSTRITMPIANAIAICVLCSPGASANAASIAIGDAQADSIATAIGLAQSDVVTTAIGLGQISPDLLATLSALGAAQ